ncbi:MAG: glycosyltransferase [Crocinitomicaceae bacterium]|nr:glycosyltransferase [Crocinitomicaceae bacterium]
MNKERISIIEPVGGHGGMEFYNYGLASGLAANQMNVWLYTCDETKVQTIENVTTVKSFGRVWSKKGLSKFSTFIRGYYRSFRESKKNKVETVNFHFFKIGFINLLVLLLAKFFKFKKVLTLHDVDPLSNQSANFLHTWSYKLVDTVIVHNEFSKIELEKKSIQSEKIYVIPHGNYIPFVSKLPPRKNDGHLNLLFFGQIKEEKGLAVLLDAITEVVKTRQNIHLTIAGRPWRRGADTYIEQISNNDLTKYVTSRFEYIPNEEVNGYFANADIVVLPYKRIYQSGVALLAMSMGRAVLASNLPPFQELIEDGRTGCLFETENSLELSKKIIEIMDQSESLNELTENAMTMLDEQYNWIEIGKQIKHL